jgi:hypothetical protein
MAVVSTPGSRRSASLSLLSAGEPSAGELSAGVTRPERLTVTGGPASASASARRRSAAGGQGGGVDGLVGTGIASGCGDEPAAGADSLVAVRGRQEASASSRSSSVIRADEGCGADPATG